MTFHSKARSCAGTSLGDAGVYAWKHVLGPMLSALQMRVTFQLLVDTLAVGKLMVPVPPPTSILM
jgi:hypothetical protein